MTTGTKSLLFGVHQFVWHPITVWLAWRALYHKCPSFWECVAIFTHDWGYWGCEYMDDARGEQHPVVGAGIIHGLYLKANGYSLDDCESADKLFLLVKYHSRYLAARDGEQPSKLCWADKLSMSYDPMRFYLFRARLSGELSEYRKHGAEKISLIQSDSVWFAWCRFKCKHDAYCQQSAQPRNFL